MPLDTLHEPRLDMQVTSATGSRKCMVRRRTARRIGCDENSLRKCIRPLVETGLRAHDDDSRVPVLNNRHGRERPRYDTGFQARRLTVFSSLLSSADS